MPEENMIQEIDEEYVEAELVPGEGNTDHEEPPADAAAAASNAQAVTQPPASQPAFMRPAETQRKKVICGEELGPGRAGSGTYEEGGKIYSRYVGLAEERSGWWVVIPISGVYNPKRGDGVIGKIMEIIFQKWLVDINSPYEAIIPLSEGVDGFVDLTKVDLTKFFDYGDLIFAEIMGVDRQRHVTLTMRERKCRKLRGGRLLRVTPAKVPRIIGKGGSMVEMIKEKTGTQIVVGQNGIVWVRGDNEDIAAEAVLRIEERAHTSGLTDHIKALLEERMKGRPPVIPRKRDEEQEGWAAREQREGGGQGSQGGQWSQGGGDGGGFGSRDRFPKGGVDDIEEL